MNSRRQHRTSFWLPAFPPFPRALTPFLSAFLPQVGTRAAQRVAISPLESALTKTPPVTPLESALTKTPGGTRVCVATRLDAAPILAGEEERGIANFLEYNPEQA